MLGSIALYSLLSVFAVSLLAFLGILTFGIKADRMSKLLIYVISFSAGALFGDAFLHLIPDIAETGFTLSTSIYILLGILIFFILEKLVHHQHYHSEEDHEHHKKHNHKHVKPFAYVNLVGSALHNLIDGMIITASYFISIPTGFATTLAVFLHEIPHEIGDFGVLVHGGFSKGKALFVNFISALFAVLGCVLALFLEKYIENITGIIIPIATGGLIYIAGSDLIPELHKESESSAFWQTVFFVLGIALLGALLFIE